MTVPRWYRLSLFNFMKKIERKLHTLDASGKAPGRVASAAARLLIGKHKRDYVPNIDMGDEVEIINAGKILLTGKKIEQKNYYKHSGYQGGLKTTSLKSLMVTDPADVLRRSVSRMLPKNRLRTPRMKRLNVKK